MNTEKLTQLRDMMKRVATEPPDFTPRNDVRGFAIRANIMHTRESVKDFADLTEEQYQHICHHPAYLASGKDFSLTQSVVDHIEDVLEGRV